MPMSRRTQSKNGIVLVDRRPVWALTSPCWLESRAPDRLNARRFPFVSLATGDAARLERSSRHEGHEELEVRRRVDSSRRVNSERRAGVRLRSWGRAG